VLDGLGDEPHPGLGGKTPLEAAKKPLMDDLAKRGTSGLLFTVGKDIAPESDIAVISILGYSADSYTGRGPLEAHAAGLQVGRGDLAYRVNFATVGDDMEIIDRRAGRTLSPDDAKGLEEEVNRKVRLGGAAVRFSFRSTVGHRGVLVFYPSNGRLSPWVTNTDPAYRREGLFGVALPEFENRVQECTPLEGHENDDAARLSASITNEFIKKSHAVLDECAVNTRRKERGEPAANVILTRDGGAGLPDFRSIRDLYGARFGCFVEMPVERGIALLTGMDIIEVGKLSGDRGKDYPVLARKVLDTLGTYDGLYVHLKGPDVPAHDGNYREKVRVIEDIDAFFFGKLLPDLDLDRTLVVITADHSTSCLQKAHTAHPVPLVLAGDGVAPDGTPGFGEAAAARGGLGQLVGRELMPLLMKRAGIS
jgi:2,3-bisphosphoglycerate-independent phosphoglycerate mutase